jgi:tRNA(fMet)-specific endonuclease VapC
MYLLDTNIVSYWMRGHEPVLQRIRTHSPKDLSLAAITLAEIYHGIEKSPTKKRERRERIEAIRTILKIHLFDESAAVEYGIIRTQLEKKGSVISERDLQLASIATAYGLCVITHSTKEFRRVEKLRVEDWAENRKFT